MNNELPIEYFDIEKKKAGNIITYKGFPLEEKQYKTKSNHSLNKEQFSVFDGFNENKFKKGYNEFF